MNKKSDQNTPLLESRLNLFKLNKIDRDIYTWTGESIGWARIFGGQVMAQTLIAAYETIKKEHLAHFERSTRQRANFFSFGILIFCM